MLVITIPESQDVERRYIATELFVRRLGIPVSIVVAERSNTLISGPNRRSLIVHDGLFKTAPEQWLAAGSLPSSPPLTLASLAPLYAGAQVEPNLPFLPVIGRGGEATVTCSSDGACVTIEADLFGSAFFFLTRYEEVAQPDQADRFQRFPASASYAARHGFLDRPVVDEYVALLAACVARLWPEIPLPRPTFRMAISHDVDLPLKYGFASAARVLGGGLRDLARQRSLRQFTTRMSTWHAVRSGNTAVDPYNTFEWLMCESERRGVNSAFYFIADRPAGNLDALYEIDHPWIAALIGSIHQRGHEVGLHASFNSYLSAQQTKHEFDRLRAVCDRAGVRQSRWGGRQHFLRWKTPVTYRNWEAAGLDYDSTQSFAQQAGFRCGTSHEFHPFDLLERRTMKLLERPLIAMESSVINYMKLGLHQGAADEFTRLKSRCKAQGGMFTLLWHNSNLTTEAQRALYLNVLDA